MSTRARLISFAAALLFAFGTAAAVGAAVGPIDVGGSTPTTAPPTGHPNGH
jgi:hypothetical protein